MPIIIILAILTISGLGFGGFEFWQNIQKDHEIKTLQAEKAAGQKDEEKVEVSEEQNDPPAEQTEQPEVKPDKSLDQEITLQFGSFKAKVKIPDDLVAFSYLLDGYYHAYLWGTVHHRGDQAVGEGAAWGNEKIESPFLAKVYLDYKNNYREYCSVEKGTFILDIDDKTALCYKETDNLSNYYSDSDMTTYIKPTLEIMKQTFTNADNYIKL